MKIRIILSIPAIYAAVNLSAQEAPRPFADYPDPIGAYLERIQQGRQEHAFKADADFSQWQKRARRALIELIGLKRMGEDLAGFEPEVKPGKADASPEAALKEETDVFFPQSGGTMKCPVYMRSKLGAGSEIKGPAIVEQYDSTTVVNPGWTGRVDEWGTLILRKTDS